MNLANLTNCTISKFDICLHKGALECVGNVNISSNAFLRLKYGGFATNVCVFRIFFVSIKSKFVEECVPIILSRNLGFFWKERFDFFNIEEFAIVP